MTKIFVRERRHVGQGAGRPRFAVVAVVGADLKVYRNFLRQAELDKIAQEAGAEVVYLPRGEHTGEEGKGRGGRRRRRTPAED